MQTLYEYDVFYLYLMSRWIGLGLGLTLINYLNVEQARDKARAPSLHTSGSHDPPCERKRTLNVEQARQSSGTEHNERIARSAMWAEANMMKLKIDINVEQATIQA